MKSSLRLKGYDYRKAGYYHVVINTAFRHPLFGEIINFKMELSKLGQILLEEIENTVVLRKNVLIDTFVIMPDHVHLIIEIKNIYKEGTCPSSRPAARTIKNPCLAIAKQGIADTYRGKYPFNKKCFFKRGN